MIDWSQFDKEDFETLINSYLSQHHPVYKGSNRVAVLEIRDKDIKFGIAGVTGVMFLSKKSLEYLIPGLIGDRVIDHISIENSKNKVISQMEELCNSLDEHLRLWRTAGSGGTCGHGIGAALNNAKKNLEFFRKLYCN
jgi:hypothetical protein